MRSHWTTLMVSVFALSLLAACGGGGGGGGDPLGGGADTVTLSRGATTTIYVEKSVPGPLSGYDPWIKLYYAPTVTTTYIYLRNDCTGAQICSYNETFEIRFDGNAKTTGTIAGGSAQVYYSTAVPLYSFGATSGTVTVTQYGPVGGHVQGTFIVSNGSTTLSGAFTVTREADQ